MKRILIILIATCLSVGAVTLIWNALSSKQMPVGAASRTQVVSSTFLNTATPDAMVSTGTSVAIPTLVTTTLDVPLYPGAEISYQSCENTLPDHCGYYLMTSDAPQNVRNFYADELAKRGWVIIEEKKNGESWDVELYWRNKEGVAPMRWFLQMFTYRMGGGTRIYLLYDPWPDAYKVPLYPDARQVDIRWETDNVYGIDAKRVTSYLTSGTQAEIAAYYTEVLQEHGWIYSEWQPSTGLNFGKAVQDFASSGVEIRLYPAEAGQTKVELWARGTEIEADYMARVHREPNP